ncbi:MAG: hypothetical protein M3406_15425 [Chloroflexota bacterium]|nr:hypothetical protein [Chloroflexota bacterium]
MNAARDKFLQRSRKFRDQIQEDGLARTLGMMDSPLDVSPADDAETLVRLGQKLTDFVEDERTWIAELEDGACIADALDLYETALSQVEVVVARLFEAPLDAGSARVRAEAANEDAEEALEVVEAAIPEDCA